MGEMAQLALGNFLFWVSVCLFILYILYRFIKRFVEKNDKDFTRVEGRNRGGFLRKLIFTTIYSAMVTCAVYLMENDRSSAITFFIVFFILGLLDKDRVRESKVSQSNSRKILSAIAYLVLFCVLFFLTITFTASIMSKVGAWVIIFLIYFLEKMEKKYLISDNEHS